MTTTSAQPKAHFSELVKLTARQKEALKHLNSGKVKFLLYGGALGGGKSFFIRWYALRRLLQLGQQGYERVVAGVFCEDYPSLKDRQLQRIYQEFPEWIGKMHQDHKVYGKCFILEPEYGSGVIAFRNLDDPSKYQSAEFALICVDELTKNEYDTFVFLFSRLRWPGLIDVECQFIGCTNPGGPGHAWVKQLWIDNDFPEEWTTPTDYRSQFKFVQSKADDNPHLDASYWAHLQTLPPNLRAAFRDGDWGVFLGQAFPEFSKQLHVIRRQPVPDNAPLYMTFDWGFGKPFSIGWWWVDNDGRIYRFAEWYGWTGVPDQGLRMADTDIAKGVIKREVEMGIWDRRVTRITGHDCFAKKPDYKGGGQGKSTAETFSEYNLLLEKGDPTRELKIRAFRERLRIPENSLPMMLIYEDCEQFIRTIPNLIMDERHPEDIDTDTEDHVYDEACFLCMERPLLPERPKPALTMAQKDFMNITGVDPRTGNEAAGGSAIVLDDEYNDFGM